MTEREPMSNDIVAIEVQNRRLGNMYDRTYNSRWGDSTFRAGALVGPSAVSVSFRVNGNEEWEHFDYSWYEYRFRGLVRSTNMWTYVPIIEPSGELLGKYITMHQAGKSP